jgi:hypothetical protein
MTETAVGMTEAIRRSAAIALRDASQAVEG